MGKGRRLEVAGHLTVMELFERYRGAEDAALKAHLQVIWLKAQGWQTRDVARSTGFKPDWVRRLVHRYNEHGPESLGDRRVNNGREPLLTEAQRKELLAALAKPSPYGGLWTSAKVARWIGERLGRKVWPQRGWVYLRDLGMTLQRPRPRHVKADPGAQAAFKKKFPRILRRVHRECPGARVELWAQDEARLGLIPIVRRAWAHRGERPLALGQRRYQWLYLYGFVRPGGGEVQWLILPEVDTEVFSLALKHFAEAVGAGPRKRIVLVLDRAGWHASNHLVVPEGIHLVFLPSYSPELQPAEHLWPLVHEAMANQRVETLDELEDLLSERCRALAADAELIRSNTLFHWWPIDYARWGSINGKSYEIGDERLQRTLHYGSRPQARGGASPRSRRGRLTSPSNGRRSSQ